MEGTLPYVAMQGTRNTAGYACVSWQSCDIMERCIVYTHIYIYIYCTVCSEKLNPCSIYPLCYINWRIYFRTNSCKMNWDWGTCDRCVGIWTKTVFNYAELRDSVKILRIWRSGDITGLTWPPLGVWSTRNNTSLGFYMSALLYNTQITRRDAPNWLVLRYAYLPWAHRGILYSSVLPTKQNTPF